MSDPSSTTSAPDASSEQLPAGGVFGNPSGPQSADVAEPSIVDTILNLNEFLSGEVRRAERTARFATRPDLEARIDELDAELEGMTDEQGRSVSGPPPAERTIGEYAAPLSAAGEKAEQIRELQEEYARSFRSVRLRQMSADDWTAFQAKHRKALDAGTPFPDEVWDELIVACAIHPTITAEQMRQLRAKLGHPQINQIALAAWQVNTQSGVSVPKSRLSSAVLRRERPATS